MTTAVVMIKSLAVAARETKWESARRWEHIRLLLGEGAVFFKDL